MQGYSWVTIRLSVLSYATRQCENGGSIEAKARGSSFILMAAEVIERTGAGDVEVVALNERNGGAS